MAPPPRESGRRRGGARRGRGAALYVVSATFFLLAGYIVYGSVPALLKGEAPDASPVGVALAGLSLLIMPALAWAKRRTAGRMASRALAGASKETWVCSWMSFSLLLGARLDLVFGLWWADSVAALLMLPVILREGWEALHNARGREAT